jgi:hypothetical protein
MKSALVTSLFLAACATEDTSTNTSLTRLPGECGPFETHVVGIRDLPTLEPTGDGGPVVLRVDRPGKHTIVVSAQSTASWKIVAGNGAQVTHVYAVGMARQKVTAPDGAEVLTESAAEGGASACGYAWPASPDCDTKSLLRLAAIRTNKHATSFHGCAAAKSFTIGEDMAVTSDCGVEQSDVITRCDGDTDEGDCTGITLY